MQSRQLNTKTSNRSKTFGKPFIWRSCRKWLGFGLAALAVSDSNAASIFRNGIGAADQGMSGATIARPQDALGVMSANPAALGDVDAWSVSFGLTGAVPGGRFDNASNSNQRMANSFGGFPDVALLIPVENWKVNFGFSITTDSAGESDWEFSDSPGGLSGVTSYGVTSHRAKIVLVRTAVGVGLPINEKLSMGASIGVVYNDNELESPYTFQTEPALAGLKTLLDLHSDGIGWNGELGFLYKATDKLRFGLTYRSRTRVQADGTASGNAGVEFAALGAPFSGFRPDFAYDVNVQNTFPQMVKLGGSYECTDRFRVAMQVDWYNWEDAFDKLRVSLSNGNNGDINGALGRNTLYDEMPLGWQNRFVYRTGLEFDVNEAIQLRGGYSYGKSPIPDGTVVPMSAAIFEHNLSAGAGYSWSRCSVDLAYQWDIPKTRKVGTSGIRAGEFSNSATSTGIHWIGLTFGMTFK